MLMLTVTDFFPFGDPQEKAVLSGDAVVASYVATQWRRL